MTTFNRLVAACLICLQAITLPLAAEREYGDVVVAELLRVYDGDTFFVNIHGWPAIIGSDVGIRVAGIDTPELNGDSDYERQLAEKARLFAENRLRNARVITLKRMRRDKYFRIVADVFVDKYSLGKEMVRVGLAVEYDGGAKHSW